MLKHSDYKEIFNTLYNGFYNKYRLKELRVRTDKEWEILLKDVDELCKHYNNKIVNSALLEFVLHFEEQEKAIKKGIEIEL